MKGPTQTVEEMRAELRSILGLLQGDPQTVARWREISDGLRRVARAAGEHRDAAIERQRSVS